MAGFNKGQLIHWITSNLRGLPRHESQKFGPEIPVRRSKDPNRDYPRPGGSERPEKDNGICPASVDRPCGEVPGDDIHRSFADAGKAGCGQDE
jgi:hypothetical protein